MTNHEEVKEFLRDIDSNADLYIPRLDLHDYGRIANSHSFAFWKANKAWREFKNEVLNVFLEFWQNLKGIFK